MAGARWLGSAGDTRSRTSEANVCCTGENCESVNSRLFRRDSSFTHTNGSHVCASLLLAVLAALSLLGRVIDTLQISRLDHQKCRQVRDCCLRFVSVYQSHAFSIISIVPQSNAFSFACDIRWVRFCPRPFASCGAAIVLLGFALCSDERMLGPKRRQASHHQAFTDHNDSRHH